MKIPVYDKEIADGLADVIKNNNSIAYVTKLDSKVVTNKIYDLAVANSTRKIDRIDLHPIQTILVSTGWNQNDDIFIKNEVWDARYSAEDKPFNFMHDQSDIIGHIIDNFAIDGDNNLIDMNSSAADIPDKFHLITPAVIYKAWDDPVKAARIMKLIDEIQANKWFVSMECLFADFDYGIMSDNGESRIITRDKSTAGLTKFLRKYGGSGKINGYAIGRVLKKIIFSGKGLVNNPANPESIILNNNITFRSISADLGYINLSNGNPNVKEKQMSTDNKDHLKVEDSSVYKLVKAERDELKTVVAELTQKLSETNSKAFEAEMTSLKEQVEDLTAKYTASAKSVEDLTAENKKLSTAKVELENKVAKAEAARLVSERTASLVALGASAAEAADIVQKFEGIDSKQFDNMVDLVKDRWAKSKVETETEPTSDENDVVDSAKAGKDMQLGVDSDTSLEELSTSVAAWWAASKKKAK